MVFEYNESTGEVEKIVPFRNETQQSENLDYQKMVALVTLRKEFEFHNYGLYLATRNTFANQ